MIGRKQRLLCKLTAVFTFLMIFIFAAGLFRLPVNAATPTITAKQSFPPNCYYHYDGKIWIYSTSKYKKEVKKAIRLMNKKYNVYRYTAKKTKSDVWISDKANPPGRKNLAGTWIVKGRIFLYTRNMNRLSKPDRVLTIAHELGHAAGLGHSDSRKSLMYPYIDRMKTRQLSKADVRALKKAKAYSKKENVKRRQMLDAMLEAERDGKGIRFAIASKARFVLAFPKRGTTYSSSNTDILTTRRTGVIDLTGFGQVTLTVNNAGKKHRFRILIEQK